MDYGLSLSIVHLCRKFQDMDPYTFVECMPDFADNLYLLHTPVYMQEAIQYIPLGMNTLRGHRPLYNDYKVHKAKVCKDLYPQVELK